MSDDAALIATIRGRDINLKALLTELRRELVQTDQIADRVGRGIGQQVTAGTVQAERATLRYAQSLASVQRAQGDTAGAVATYRQALQSLTPNTVEANSATVKLIQLQGQLARESRATAQSLLQTSSASRSMQAAMRGSTGYAQQFGAAVKGELLGMIGPAAAAAAAVAAVGKGVELAQAGAQADLVEQRFEQLARAAGTTGTALRAALQEASHGEMSDLNLELAANRAQLLGVAKSAQDFSVLMAIARDRAQLMGKSTTEAFNQLIEGVGKAEPELLDNLGIIISADEANKQYAATLGKTASELTKVERAEAMRQAVLAQGQATLAQTGGAIESSKGALDRWVAAWENAANRIGAVLARVYDTKGETEKLDKISARLSQLIPDDATQKTAQIGGAIRAITNEYAQLRQTAPEAAAALGSLLPALQAAAAGSAEHAQIIQDLVMGYAHHTVSAQELRDALAGLQAQQDQATVGTMTGADAHDRATVAANQHAQMTAQATAATAAHAAAAQQDAAQSLLSAVHTDQLSMAKAILEQQARQAAQALILAGDAGAAKAAQLAASSNLVDQLTAAYARLGLQAQQAAQMALTAARMAASVAPGLNTILPGLSAVLGGLKEAARTGKPVDIGLTPVSSPRSRARGGGGSRGSGSGAAQVSEAQRTAQQLATTARQSATQRESIERDHQEAMAEIAEAGAKKRQEAMENFASGRSRNRADFYKQLATMDDPALRQQLSAQYEQIALDAERIAQQQGADVAQAYKDAAIKAAQAQAEIQQEIAKAREEGDLGKAEYLEGVAKLQADADQAELARIKAQGSAIATETARRYAAEEEAYRKHLDRMARDYQEKIGALSPGAALPPPSSAAPAAGSTASSATAPRSPSSAGSGAVEVSAPDVVRALEVLQGRVEAVEKAVQSGSRQVEGAVRSLKTSGSFQS